MMGRISTIFQFISGFILGIVLMTGTAAGLGFLYVSKMTQTPPKPVFSEEKETPSESKTEEKPATSPESTQAKSEPETASSEEKAEELPPNAYKARVTWEQGLSLRDKPDLNAARIGGIEHNAEIIILEESQDKQWQRVRLPWSEQEGWVKGGNVERVY